MKGHIGSLNVGTALVLGVLTGFLTVQGPVGIVLVFLFTVLITVVLTPVSLWTGILLLSIPLSFSGILPVVDLSESIQITAVDLILLVVALKLIQQWHQVRWPFQVPLWYGFIAFVGTQLVALLAANLNGIGNVLPGLIAFTRLVSQVFLGLLLASVVERAEVQRTLGWFRWLGMLTSWSIILQWLLALAGLPLGNIFGNRYTGVFGDPAQASIFTLLFVFIAGEQVLYQRRGYVELLATAFAFMLTGTRGSMTVLVGGALWLLVMSARSTLTSWRKTLLSIIFIVFTALMLVTGPLSERITPVALSQSWVTRFDPFVRAWRIFLNNPVFGVGYTGTTVVADQFSIGLRYLRGGIFNQYLQVLAESGVVGFIGFLLLLTATWRSISNDRISTIPFEQQPFVNAIRAWVLAIFVAYQTETWWQPGSIISYTLWAVVGLAISLQQVSIPVDRWHTGRGGSVQSNWVPRTNV
ncbi:MAG: O-antigen ligase family protein [Bacillota bacterium]